MTNKGELTNICGTAAIKPEHTSPSVNKVEMTPSQKQHNAFVPAHETHPQQQHDTACNFRRAEC